LVSSGELNLGGCLLVAVVAALLADAIWYGIGRVKGAGVLHLMCRLSWKPDSCVSKTKILFLRYGTQTLLFSKFVPGLSTLAPPLTGMTRVPFFRFVIYDTVGAALWAFAPLVAGAFLQKRVQAFQFQASSLIPYLPWICGALILGVLAWRYWNRRRYFKELRQCLQDGITAEELKQRMDRGEDVVLLDIRHEVNARAQPVAIPGAQWIPYSTLTRSPGSLL
jgi:membrane protein DedA with SNARE-associated domain